MLLGTLQTARPAHAYLWEEDTPVNAAVGSLALTEIYEPSTLKIEWVYADLGSTPAEFEIERRVGGSGTVLGTTTNNYWVDDTGFTSGTTYEYRVRVKVDAEDSLFLGPPPGCANPMDVFYRSVATGMPWVTTSVVPQRALVDQNQAVDSRYDPRYGNPTYLDFAFGSRAWRGGLFVGFASDPSRVGRSFLRFNLDALPMGATYLRGSVNAYHTRSLVTGSLSIGCQAITDVSWLASALRWTTAPTVSPGSATHFFTVDYDSTDPGATTTWAHWLLHDDIEAAIAGSGLLSVALTSSNETTSRWIYFAKKEFNTSLSPTVLYAYAPAP